MLNHDLDEDALPSVAPRTKIVNVPGGTTQATLYPSVIPGTPTAIVLPAMGTPARVYARLARVLNFHGLNAVTIDLRGVGTSSLRADRHHDWGYLDLVDDETDAAVALARDAFPDTPFFFLGHSLGGHLALLHLARHPASGVTGAVLVASGSPYVRLYRGFSWLVLQALVALARVTSERRGVWRGDKYRFGGIQPRTLMREWTAFARTGFLVPEGDPAWNAEAALHELRSPIVALAMRGDHYAPERAIRHLTAKTAAAISEEHVAHAIPAHAPGHFGWLRDPETTACAIAANLGRLGLSRSLS